MTKPTPNDQPVDVYPGMRLRCTCGRETVIRWNGDRYEADDSTWTYHVDPVNDSYSRLWTCGDPAGHGSSIVEFLPRPGYRLSRGSRP
jgi:hypothetical protein